MKFSESWLRSFCNPSLSAAELADRLTMAGVEVEFVRDFAGAEFLVERDGAGVEAVVVFPAAVEINP